MGRRVLVIAVLVAAFFFFRSKKAGNERDVTPEAKGSSPSAAFGCVAAAERANAALHDASMLVLRPPVDANAWSSEESRVSSAISTAESTCMGGTRETDVKALESARAALTLMRTSLSDLSSAARGAGGAMDLARRQGEIDAHLDAARRGSD
jgi:hypothetical protein